MSDQQIRSFTHQLCSLQMKDSNGIKHIASVNEKNGITRPNGIYPEHWIDTWYEHEGGDDHRGVRPQVGVTMLKAEMDGLTPSRAGTRQPGTMWAMPS